MGDEAQCSAVPVGKHKSIVTFDGLSVGGVGGLGLVGIGPQLMVSNEKSTILAAIGRKE